MNYEKINNFTYSIKNNKNINNTNTNPNTNTNTNINTIFFTSIINSKILENNSAYLIKKKDGYNESINSITFSALTVERATDFFIGKSLDEKYQLVIKLLWCINKQNNSLKEFGQGFYNICLHDILMIDSSVFIFINLDYIKQIKNDCYIINFPFIKNEHLLPELTEIKSIPCTVNTNCFNYTLGSIAFYILFKKYFKNCTTCTTCTMNLKIELNCIYKTKLYWCIIKCLKNNVMILI